MLGVDEEHGPTRLGDPVDLLDGGPPFNPVLHGPNGDVGGDHVEGRAGELHAAHVSSLEVSRRAATIRTIPRPQPTSRTSSPPSRGSWSNRRSQTTNFPRNVMWRNTSAWENRSTAKASHQAMDVVVEATTAPTKATAPKTALRSGTQGASIPYLPAIRRRS